ncbi:hypothetical protein HZ996_06380 [Cryomorphaceae bacterium]|nr:hypothetical protein HZ996_06380 [Cryomorphaceae bacterium]
MEFEGLNSWGLRALFAFYLLGGINHFVMPEFYWGLIPPYLPFPGTLNILAGIAEVVLAFGLLIRETRRIAGFAIILMLVTFIPAHVYFIQIGSCIPDGLCVSPTIGWARLLVVHPLLMWWAYSSTRKSINHA